MFNAIAPDRRNDPGYAKIGTDPLLRYRCNDGLWIRAVLVNPLNAQMKGLLTQGMY